MSWALPNEDMSWALLWDAESGRPRGEAFPNWSWLSWRGRIWPGAPEEIAGRPYYPHRYPFDLTIWRRSSSGLEIIFNKAYEDIEKPERIQLQGTPFRTHTTYMALTVLLPSETWTTPKPSDYSALRASCCTFPPNPGIILT